MRPGLRAVFGGVALVVLAAGGFSAVCLSGGCGGGGVDKQFEPQQPLARWDNAEWAFVLDKLVTDDGFVRYDLLKENTDGVRDALYRYVGQLQAVSPDTRPELFPTQDDKLAYWINAYNAIMLHRIVERGYPEKVTSGLPPGAVFFTDKTPVGGTPITLDALEKTKVRTSGDPRIHFALNCASYSCPPLRDEPFEGARLGQQMDEQGRRYMNDPLQRGVKRIDADTVGLGNIFTKWYTDEWTSHHAKQTGQSNPTLLDSIRPYAGPDSPVQSARDYEEIGYDWSLNRADRARPGQG